MPRAVTPRPLMTAPTSRLFRVLLPGGSTVAHGVLEAAPAGAVRLLAAAHDLQLHTTNHTAPGGSHRCADSR
jgi:hypothetical protein